MCVQYVTEIVLQLCPLFLLNNTVDCSGVRIRIRMCTRGWVRGWCVRVHRLKSCLLNQVKSEHIPPTLVEELFGDGWVWT